MFAVLCRFGRWRTVVTNALPLDRSDVETLDVVARAPAFVLATLYRSSKVLYRPVKRNVSSRFLMEHQVLPVATRLFVEVFFPFRGQFCQGSAHIVRADGEFLLGENEVKGQCRWKLVERFVVEPVFDLLRFHSVGNAIFAIRESFVGQVLLEFLSFLRASALRSMRSGIVP